MSLPVSAPIQTPTSAREARVDRFLARVAALTPRQWGELDATGERFEAADPLAWWERAGRLAAFASRLPAAEDALHVLGFVGMGLGALARTVTGRRGPRYARPFIPAAASGEARLIGARLETLWDVAATQPGGPGASLSCLTLALLALWLRDHVSAEGFAQLYGLVEPVIPAASL